MVISAPLHQPLMPYAQRCRQELFSLEMTGDEASVTLSQGAINLWFCKSLDRSLAAKILIIISRLDSTAEHEKEVACSFEKISEFERNGYILTSYAKKVSIYHAIFLVPFSNPKALEKFIDSIAEDLKKEDVRIALRWGGGRSSMKVTCQELERLGCFHFTNAVYKEEEVKEGQTKKAESPRRGNFK